MSAYGQEENEGTNVLFDTADAFRFSLRRKVREALLIMVEQEIEQLCGQAWHPDSEAVCYRAGSAPSSVEVAGLEQTPVSRLLSSNLRSQLFLSLDEIEAIGLC